MEILVDPKLLTCATYATEVNRLPLSELLIPGAQHYLSVLRRMCITQSVSMVLGKHRISGFFWGAG